MVKEPAVPLLEQLRESPVKRMSVVAALATVLGLTSEIASELSAQMPVFPKEASENLSKILQISPRAEQECAESTLLAWVESSRSQRFSEMGLTDQSYHWCEGEGYLTVDRVAFSDGLFVGPKEGFIAPTWTLTDKRELSDGVVVCFENDSIVRPAYTHCEVHHSVDSTLASGSF